ncbi:hypothetical protein B0J14DRAFT_44341 [Halenospora varia]|nr:hypothetical protein B0J14DRAFT_44341 [Halenospora varia]
MDNLVRRLAVQKFVQSRNAVCAGPCRRPMLFQGWANGRAALRARACTFGPPFRAPPGPALFLQWTCRRLPRRLPLGLLGSIRPNFMLDLISSPPRDRISLLLLFCIRFVVNTFIHSLFYFISFHQSRAGPRHWLYTISISTIFTVRAKTTLIVKLPRRAAS